MQGSIRDRGWSAEYLRSTDNVLLAEKGEQLSISKNLCASLEAKNGLQSTWMKNLNIISPYTGVSH